MSTIKKNVTPSAAEASRVQRVIQSIKTKGLLPHARYLGCARHDVLGSMYFRCTSYLHIPPTLLLSYPHQMKHLVVLTGAGVSAESGIRTFRDTNGLWENHRVEDVASPEGFAGNPALWYSIFITSAAPRCPHGTAQRRPPRPGRLRGAARLAREHHHPERGRPARAGRLDHCAAPARHASNRMRFRGR